MKLNVGIILLMSSYSLLVSNEWRKITLIFLYKFYSYIGTLQFKINYNYTGNIYLILSFVLIIVLV